MGADSLLGPGVFVDRDGTINEERGYIARVEDLSLLPHSAEGIRLLNRLGLKVVVVTNQSGVARGYLTEERLREINAYMERLLEEEGAKLDGVYYCPHHPFYGDVNYRQNCPCRKPEPGMVIRASAYYLIKPNLSYTVGDKKEDIELATRIGAKSILVLTGMGRKMIQEGARPSYLAANLLDAALWIENDQTLHHR